MKLDIFFKNVGQGDTIILEWYEKSNSNEKKFGMIDCNLVNNDIKTITKHIEDSNIQVFEFVIMSHPHSDHFSGFLIFFDYCETHNIIIQKFIHTSSHVRAYVTEILSKKISKNKELYPYMGNMVGKKHSEKLYNIFARLTEQYKVKKFIKNVKIAVADSEIKLTDTVKMKFLSPHEYEEIPEFITKTYPANSGKQSLGNNPHANYLSSLIQIYDVNDTWQIFLCSDCTSFTFDRLKKETDLFSSLQNNKTIGIQIPHHGSIENHVENFWDNFMGDKDAFAVVSVGLGHDHPHLDTVRYFEEKSKGLHSTAFVGGYKIFHSKLASGDSTDSQFPYLMLPGISVYDFSEKNAEGEIICGEKQLWLEIESGKLKDYKILNVEKK